MISFGTLCCALIRARRRELIGTSAIVIIDQRICSFSQRRFRSKAACVGCAFGRIGLFEYEVILRKKRGKELEFLVSRAH